MANKTALCRECLCVIAANGVEGHMDWHLKLNRAILMASGLVDNKEIDVMINNSRLALEGKVTVVW